jgi:hypothetical protein
VKACSSAWCVNDLRIEVRGERCWRVEREKMEEAAQSLSNDFIMCANRSNNIFGHQSSGKRTDIHRP